MENVALGETCSLHWKKGIKERSICTINTTPFKVTTVWDESYNRYSNGLA